MHFVVQRQRMVPGSPIVADPRVSVDDECVDPKLMQPRGNGEARLAAADHDDRRIATGIAT